MFTYDVNNWRGDKHHVLVPVTDRTISSIMCYNCKKWGHISHNFTDPDHCATYSNSATGGNGIRQGIYSLQTCLLFTQDG